MFPDRRHSDDWRVLVRCPSRFVSVAEDGKPHCRVEVCGVTPMVNLASKNDADNITVWTSSVPHVRRGSHSPRWRA